MSYWIGIPIGLVFGAPSVFSVSVSGATGVVLQTCASMLAVVWRKYML